MKYVLFFLLLIHGLIHLIGVAKAFDWAEIPQFTKAISKPMGILWFITSLLFLISILLFVFNNQAWGITGILATVLSQMLIFTVWQDAKFGTIPNILLFVASLMALFSWNFSRSFEKDIAQYIPFQQPEAIELLTEADLEHLPELVKKYIRLTGAIGQPKVRNFKVELQGNLRQEEGSPWMPFHSVQYNSIENPTRLFFMEATMNRLPVAGYHHYKNGKAVMDIRLLSAIKVAYQSGPQMDTAETVTFFNDLCVMAPGGLIDERVHWLAEEENKVQASFTTNGITITAWLHFDDTGALVNFISEDRYAIQKDGSLSRFPWLTPMKNHREFNGRYLPGYADAIYEYPDGEFCYGNFTITNVEYNVKTRKYNSKTKSL